jgi:hypothetical protein
LDLSSLSRYLLCLATLLVSCLLLPFASVAAQSAVVTLDVEAGFETYFRDNQWLPVYINLANDGDDVRGRLVVRPATSGSGIVNTYSTPVDLPRGARQTATLYITASSILSQLRVELLDEGEVVIASAVANVRPIQPQDRLAVVVTNATSGALDMSSIRSGGFSGYQAILTIDQLPDNAALFDAVDLVVLSDVDTGEMSSAQQDALTQWVTFGGHLIVTGGANWRATSAGIGDLLPMVLDGETTVDDLDALGQWLGGDDETLTARTLIATGALRDDSQALLRAGENVLIARRLLGAGVVDFLAADPNGAPLRNWALLPDLWYTLASSVDPQPSWSGGFSRWAQAADAVEILPGFNLLPDVLPLLGFLALYIALIGPVNYFILNRINRREWAWVTIPVLIIIFSFLAYLIGTNLRGNEATLSRLTVVRAWHDSVTARADSVVGLLSPRRTSYEFAMTDAVLRPLPLPRLLTGGLIATNAPTDAEIAQTQQFLATNFTIDASFLAEFTASAPIEAPQIRGQASISDDPDIAGQQVVRGAVSNESAFTLEEAVILARGVSYRLEEALAPGDVVDFELTLAGEDAPAPVLYTPPAFISAIGNNVNLRLTQDQSIIDILGERRFNPNIDFTFIDDSPESLESRRRQLFLASFVRDLFATTARANHIYLVGWATRSPLESELVGANWEPYDTTLYLIELESPRVPTQDEVTISGDQFNWSARSFTGARDVAPVSLQLNQDETAVFRFTPVSDARLSEVTGLELVLQEYNAGGRTIPLALWDWAVGDWVELEAIGERFPVVDYQRFIGPLNAVQVRLRGADSGGFLRVGRLSVEQTGRFSS